MDIRKTDLTEMLNDYTDEELLLLMSFREQDPKEADEAFHVFFERFKGYIWSLTFKLCSEKPEKATMREELFWVTMQKVFQKAGKFNAEFGDFRSPSSRIKSWIGQILKNELIDFLRSNPQHLELTEESQEYKLLFEAPEDYFTVEDSSASSWELEELNRGLALLTERERDILLTYYKLTLPGQKISSLLLMQLTSQYNTTPENIRQIKSRALKKLKDYFEKLQK